MLFGDWMVDRAVLLQFQHLLACDIVYFEVLVVCSLRLVVEMFKRVELLVYRISCCCVTSPLIILQ